MNGMARSFGGEIDNYGRGRPGRDPLGCMSEESAAQNDEATSKY
jgi:hypothetical protein